MDSERKNKISINSIRKQINKHKKKYTLDELEKKVLSSKNCALKITIKNDLVKVIYIGKYKKRRANNLILLIKKTVLKYKNINTTIFCNINDWSNINDDELPIFVYSAFKNTKNFVIPDYLFLNDYSKKNGRNSDNDTHNNMVLKFRDKIKFKDKKSKCFFRAGTSKNKVILGMFSNNDIVDAERSQNNFMQYEEMFKHRYTISHYMKWDSVYFFLKSDILVFMYEGFNTYLWYDLFLEDNKHYLSFKNEEEFMNKFNYIEDNPDIAMKIIKESSNICDELFKYENAIDYMGLLLLEYQKIID